MNKEELVNQIIPLLRLATPAEHSKMEAELKTHTFVELKAFLGVVSSSDYQAELAEEAILRVQAERAADFAMFQLERQRQTAPQQTREAAKHLAKDKETFAALCRQHGLSECDANFHLFRSTHSISGLAPASQEELVKFEQDRIETHNDALLRMDHGQLKARVREESEARQQETRDDQAGRELESARQRDQYGNCRPLPPEITANAIKASSAAQLKQWIRIYGSYQITTRLRGAAQEN